MTSGHPAAVEWDRLAAIYDELAASSERFHDTQACVDFLAGLAGNGPALELGVGTGRVAIPLAERDLDVHGIDVSGGMLARLRERPGGDQVSVTMGDFADVAVDQQFALVYVIFTTFFNLTTQEDQVRCFENVAQHLTDGGVFVLEADVPDLEGFVGGAQVEMSHLDAGRAILSSVRYRRATQIEESQMIVMSAKGLEFYPITVRYAWPGELDLMARLAGLELRERWGDWRRHPFTDSSHRHVSVYARH